MTPSTEVGAPLCSADVVRNIHELEVDEANGFSASTCVFPGDTINDTSLAAQIRPYMYVDSRTSAMFQSQDTTELEKYSVAYESGKLIVLEKPPQVISEETLDIVSQHHMKLDLSRHSKNGVLGLLNLGIPSLNSLEIGKEDRKFQALKASDRVLAEVSVNLRYPQNGYWSLERAKRYLNCCIFSFHSVDTYEATLTCYWY